MKKSTKRTEEQNKLRLTPTTILFGAQSKHDELEKEETDLTRQISEVTKSLSRLGNSTFQDRSKFITLGRDQVRLEKRLGRCRKAKKATADRLEKYLKNDNAVLKSRGFIFGSR